MCQFPYNLQSEHFIKRKRKTAFKERIALIARLKVSFKLYQVKSDSAIYQQPLEAFMARKPKKKKLTKPQLGQIKARKKRELERLSRPMTAEEIEKEKEFKRKNRIKLWEKKRRDSISGVKTASVRSNKTAKDRLDRKSMATASGSKKKLINVGREQKIAAYAKKHKVTLTQATIALMG